jgi:hypothetical protein
LLYGEDGIVFEGDWFSDYEARVRRAGDQERLRMVRFHHQAYSFRETDPDHVLDLIAQGQALARQLDEPWWVLFYSQYRVHALLHFRQDFREVLEPAVRNALEVRKSSYANFPRRLLIHDDLVSAYTGIDPVGYADRIREALAYLDAEVPPEGDDRYMLLGGIRQFAMELGNDAEAEQAIQHSLAVAGDDDDQERAEHFSVFAFAALAEVAWKRKDWSLLTEAAAAGLDLVRRVGHQVEHSGFLMWQAVIARHRGEKDRALGRYLQAVSRIERVRMPPDGSFFEARCGYHELAGEMADALAVRDGELARIGNRGRLAYECRVGLARCGLLARLGRLTEADLDAARAAAGKLRQPEKALAELDRLRG